MALPNIQHPSQNLTQAFSYEDLKAIPDDGNRYELINGTIRISPAPKAIH